MKMRTLALGAATALAMAAPSIAEAAWGVTTGTVNMRADSYAGAPKITTLPGGARVWIDGQQNGWYHVSYNGRAGFVSGSYVDTRVAMGPNPRDPRFDRGPRPGPGPAFNRGPAPRFGYYQKPWWDNNRQAWYDGRRWYRNGVWYNNPSGLSFGFSFGG